MAENTPKPPKEEKKKKPAPKKRATTPRKQAKSAPQEVKIVVETKPSTELSPAVLEQAVAPEHAGSKYMLPASWLSEKQVLKMLQKTPKEHVHKRPGKGGKDFDYVTGVYVKKVLNFVFGWNWDYFIIKQEIYGLSEGYGQIVTTGRLVVKDSKGNTVTKEQNGSAEVKYIKGSVEAGKPKPVNLGNDFKASATDALKKCASEFGIASDVYGKNEFKEIRQQTQEEKVETLFEQIASMVEGCNAVNPLKAINMSVANNATLTDEEKEKLYELIKAKAEKLGVDIAS